MIAAPNGREFRISCGEHCAIVTEVGATLRAYDIGKHRAVDGYSPDIFPDGARGQVLAPWANRVKDGQYTFAGLPHQLDISEVDTATAIHGLVRWIPWTIIVELPDEIRLATTIWPRPGYPFLLRLSISYRVGDNGLEVRLLARNDGTDPAPYGAGFHAYVTVGTDTIDDAMLTVPAVRRTAIDERKMPEILRTVEGTEFDFRTPRRIGTLVIESAFTELARDSAGRCSVRLETADGSRGVEVWADAAARWMQLFSGDTLPDIGRRRQGLAVEPMTCPADAFNSKIDLVTLRTGEEHEIVWGIRPT